MAVKTRAQLKAENAADFPDNTARRITPASLRGQMDDVADSTLFPEDLPGLLNGSISVIIDAASHTLTDANNGTLLYCTSSVPVTLAVPMGLQANFSCRIAQGGVGKVTLQANSGVTINSIGNHRTTAQRLVMVALNWLTTDVYLLSGDLITVPEEPPDAVPVNIQAPTITVDPLQAFSLTVSEGIWLNDPVEFLYQWMRNGSIAIDGANSTTYNIIDEDIGQLISVVVTASNEWGDTGASSAAYGPIEGVAPTNTVAPTISGGSTPSPMVGEIVVVDYGSWTGVPMPALRAQWKNSGNAILDATAIAYELQTTDLGDDVTCTVTATSTQGVAAATTAAIVPIANPDVGGPTLSALVLTPFSESSASLSVTTNEGNGVFYYVVVADGSPVPTAAQVKAGTDGADVAAAVSNSIPVGAVDTYGQNPNGMSAGTVYDAYAAQYDAAGNASNVASATFTMSGSSSPTLSDATITDACDVYVWVRSVTNNGNGSLYVSCCPAGAPAPSAAQIVAGTDGAAAAVPNANKALTAIGAHEMQIVGLTANTSYVAYIVQKIGASTYSNIVDLSFTSDILVRAFAFDGTATGISPSSGVLPFVAGDLNKPDPDGGNNAVMLHDNNDGLTGQIWFGLLVPNYFNGINRIHYTAKHQSGSEWHRTMTANVSTGTSPTHWNVTTGVTGLDYWNASRGGAAPAILSNGSGWYTFSAALNMSNVDPLIPFDGNGVYYIQFCKVDNNSGTNVRDGTNIQYLYNARITRPA